MYEKLRDKLERKIKKVNDCERKFERKRKPDEK